MRASGGGGHAFLKSSCLLQAADVLRIMGIGRNEYIHILNTCKGKKLLWRVNRSIVKDHLPTEPQIIRMEPWWHVRVVNIGALDECGWQGQGGACPCHQASAVCVLC